MIQYILIQNSDYVEFQDIRGFINDVDVHKHIHDIQEFITQSSECQGVHIEYIKSVLKKAHYILIMRVDRILVGFAAAEVVQNTTRGNIFYDNGYEDCLYISIICTIPRKGYGKTLIDKLDSLKKQIELTSLCLCSIDSAKDFYEKMGFLKNDEVSDELCGEEHFMYMD